MTSPAEARAPNALDLLLRSPDPPEALAREITALGAENILNIGNLPRPVRETAVREAARVAADLLQVNLLGVLVSGWREYRDIVAAARSTLAAPGSPELVSMATHEVTMDEHPSVNVLVDGRRVAHLELDLSIVCDVNGLLLLISGGYLVAIRSGRCDITVTLTVQGAELISRQSCLDLPGVVKAGRGIRLLPVTEYPVVVRAGREHPSGSTAASTRA